VLIGIGEGLISALVVGAVLATRPDLVVGARDLGAAAVEERPALGVRTFAIGAFIVAVLTATVVSQFAADDPDGLERVAIDEGFVDQADGHAFADAPFADYATSGIDNETLSLAVAGAAGVLLTIVVGAGILGAARRGHRAPTATA
jgi:cobalt/nickel transport system permease protein